MRDCRQTNHSFDSHGMICNDIYNRLFWGENFTTDFVYLKDLINIDGWRYNLVLLMATVIECLGNLLIVIILCRQQLGSKFEIKFLFSSFD